METEHPIDSHRDGAGRSSFARMARPRASAILAPKQDRATQIDFAPVAEPGRGQPRPGADRAVAQDGRLPEGRRQSVLVSRAMDRPRSRSEERDRRRTCPADRALRPAPLRRAAFAVAGRPSSPGTIKDNRSSSPPGHTTVVGVSCTKADEFCFCTSVGGGPGDTTGSDILLTAAQGGGYLAEILTEKGKALVAGAGGCSSPPPARRRQASWPRSTRAVRPPRTRASAGRPVRE